MEMLITGKIGEADFPTMCEEIALLAIEKRYHVATIHNLENKVKELEIVLKEYKELAERLRPKEE